MANKWIKKLGLGIAAIMTVSQVSGIVCLAAFDDAEAENVMEELERIVMETVDTCDKQHIIDSNTIKTKVKSNLSGFLFKTTRRSPMILPVITEI